MTDITSGKSNDNNKAVTSKSSELSAPTFSPLPPLSCSASHWSVTQLDNQSEVSISPDLTGTAATNLVSQLETIMYEGHSYVIQFCFACVIYCYNVLYFIYN